MFIVSKDVRDNRISFNYPSKQLLISTTRQFINAQSYPESGTLLDAHPPVVLQPRVGHSPLLFLLQQHIDHIAAYSNCSRKEEEVQNGFFGYLQHHLSPVVLLELFLVFLHSGFSYGDDRRVSEFLHWPQLHEVSWVFCLNRPRHRQIHYKFASNAFEILGVCCEQRQKFNCMRLYPSLRRGISIKFVFAPESGHISAVILERAFNCNIESLHDVLIRCFEQLYEVRIDARWKMLILDWHQVIEKLPLLYLLLLLLFLLHLRILVPQNAVNIGQGKLV